MKNLIIALALLTLNQAHAACETKTAGEMIYLLDGNDSPYLLDSDGAETLVQCLAKIDLTIPAIEALKAANVCKKTARETYAYYDASPGSTDWRRPVVRNCR